MCITASGICANWRETSGPGKICVSAGEGPAAFQPTVWGGEMGEKQRKAGASSPAVASVPAIGDLPPVLQTYIVTIFDTELNAALRDHAKARGVSMQAIMVYATRMYLGLD